MSIRIIPQDELGSSEKRTADMIPPLLFPRLRIYTTAAPSVCASWQKIILWVITCALLRLSPTPGEVVLYDHPLEMDLTARIKEASAQGKPRWIFTFCRVISTGKSC